VLTAAAGAHPNASTKRACTVDPGESSQSPDPRRLGTGWRPRKPSRDYRAHDCADGSAAPAARPKRGAPVRAHAAHHPRRGARPVFVHGEQDVLLSLASQYEPGAGRSGAVLAALLSMLLAAVAVVSGALLRRVLYTDPDGDLSRTPSLDRFAEHRAAQARSA
jgi:hypothetical protein